MDTEAKQTMMGTEKEHTPLKAERRTPNAEGATRLQPSALIVQRSKQEHTPGPIQLDDLIIDLEGYRITRASGPVIRITEQEQRLLRVLLGARGRVLTLEELGRQVWGFSCGYSIQGIWNCTKRLRQKLGDSGKQQRYIKTIRSVGLCIDPPAAPGDPDTQLASTNASLETIRSRP
jgi:DNA-binding response OmpR family regulator